MDRRTAGVYTKLLFIFVKWPYLSKQDRRIEVVFTFQCPPSKYIGGTALDAQRRSGSPKLVNLFSINQRL